MSLDAAIARMLNAVAGRNKVIDFTIVALASWPAYLLCAQLLIALYAYPTYRAPYFLMSLLSPALVSRFVIVSILYLSYKRPRPSSTQGIHVLLHSSNPSFPSGHATFFSALSTALYIIGVPGASYFAGVTAVMCISRVVAGVHYPLDIIGGCIIGVGTTVLYFFAFSI